jgi:predicted small metal-binding protein
MMGVSRLNGLSTKGDFMALKYSCASAGADTCGFSTTANDKAELARQLAHHLTTVHSVKTPTQTIVRYLIKCAEEGGNLQRA